MTPVVTVPVLFTPRPEWYERANCRGLGAGLFYLDRGVDDSTAKAVCAGCEVRTQCLTEALERHEMYGVWGGCSVRQRRRLLGWSVA
jgi:WhiB family redox-sensing transcriptional regulator